MKYRVVLAYLPTSQEDNPFKGLPTLFPEGIENVPKRFAISFRDDYMVKECDMVLCCITRSFGGAVC